MKRNETELGKALTDLINENIKLKEELKFGKRSHLKSNIYIFKTLFPEAVNSGFEVNGLNVYKLIKDYEMALEEF